jgi:hypothetical protein
MVGASPARRSPVPRSGVRSAPGFKKTGGGSRGFGYTARMSRTPGQLRTIGEALFLAAAIFALTLKVLLPPGYMLAAQPGSSTLQLVICTGQGLVPLPDGADHGEGTTAAQGDVCAFAALGAAAPPPALAQVLFLVAAFLVVRGLRSHTPPPVRRRLASPPPPAHAPPLTA